MRNFFLGNIKALLVTFLCIVISCTQHDIKDPIKSMAEGVWAGTSSKEIDDFWPFSIEDLTKNKNLVIKVVEKDSIEIQGLFRTVNQSSGIKESVYPVFKAALSQNNILFPKKILKVNAFLPSLVIEGSGSFKNDSLNLTLTFTGQIESEITSRNYLFKAARICTDIKCSPVPAFYFGPHSLSGVTWQRRLIMTGPGYYVFTGPIQKNANYLIEKDNLPFELKITGDVSLSAYYLNDSLIIPPQYPYAGTSKVFYGNMVLSDGRSIAKMVQSYRQLTYFDTLKSR